MGSVSRFGHIIMYKVVPTSTWDVKMVMCWSGVQIVTAVKGHRHQDLSLYANESMDQEHLSHTSSKLDLMSIKPEDTQHMGS